MINHARTLLINDNVPHSDTYSDPDFHSVDLYGSPTSAAYSILFPDAETTRKRLAVDAAMCLLHRPELVPYALTFDPRVTYQVGQPANTTLTGFIHATAADAYAGEALSSLVARAVGSHTLQTLAPLLFEWPEEPQLHEDLTALKLAWLSPQDRLLSVGALVLALVYQIERHRRTNT